MADLQKMPGFVMNQQSQPGQKANGKVTQTRGASLSDDFVAYLWVATYGACAQRLQLH